MFVAVAAAAALGVWVVFAHLENTNVDSALSNQAEALLGGMLEDSGRVSLLPENRLPNLESSRSSVVAVLFDGRGHVLEASRTVPSASVLEQTALAVAHTRHQTSATLTLSGQDQRVLAQPVTLPDGSIGAFVVTRSLQSLHETVLLGGLLLIGTVVLLAAVTSALAYALAGRALRPVRSMAAAAREISEQDLHQRLALNLPRDELGELAETFNAMLARLETAFMTLQQFTADAAHELRAPLALLRAELEVSLSHARTPNEYTASQRLALTEVNRLSALADKLLLLARADAGALYPNLTAVDIGDLAEETVERWRPLAHTRGVDLSVEVRDEGSLNADADLLRHVIDNLLDNAVRHASPNGSVNVVVERESAYWKLVVSDDGPGVPRELRATVFDRFKRGDEARGRETGGAGLGLAVCRVVAEMHGGSISLDEGPDNGARFTVRLLLQHWRTAENAEP